MRQLKQGLFLMGLLCACFIGWGQNSQYTGTVLADDDGSLLLGVTVTNLSTGKKTLTNQDGFFTIEGSSGQKLRISYVGYVSRDINLESDLSISIRLVPTEKDLDNVVVTGYGQVRNKRELSYQAPVVSGEDIAATRRDNFLNALNGRVPGLTVTSTSGLPGASAQIILRGATSIGGNNQPLFVVDGVPLDNSTLNQESLIAASNSSAVGFANRNSDYTNRIADINPQDIENVVILKGPEATALYGSDGASGAIVITTRKGKAGQLRVNFDNSYRFENVYRYPEIQTKYSRGTNGVYDPTAYSNTYGFKFFGPEYPAGTPVYDNLRDFFETGFSQQYNLSVESGTQDMSYRFSAGYVQSEGVVPNTGYERLNFRLTGQTKLGKKASLNSSWAYILSNNDKVPKGAGTYYNNLITWPTDDNAADYLNADGSRKTIRSISDLTTELDNPYWDVNKNKSKDNTDRLTGTVNLNIDPAKWLHLNVIGGLDQYSTEGYYLTHPQSRYGFATKGFYSSYVQRYRNVNGTFRATFKKTIAKVITNSLSVAAFTESSHRTSNAQRGEQFYEPDFVSINNTAPLTRDAKLTEEQIRKVRFFANYTMGYKDLLFINLAGVREGISTLASKLYDKQPFYNYGSASASFIFTDLNFFRDHAKWLSYGKLRVSYATTGKGPSVPYRIDPQFAVATTTGGGLALDVFASNRDLKPERSRNFEYGGEFQFFNKRLSVDVAIYSINSTDQIVANRLSYGTGGVLKYINGGEVENKGVEIQLKGSIVRKKNFTWNTIVNFDKNRGIVKKMPADLPLYYDSDTWLFGSVRSQVSVGNSITNLVGYSFQKNDAGQLLISPTTGLPLIQSTYESIGDRTPDFKIGFINEFTFFRDFDLSVNLDIRKGGDVFNGNEAMMMLTGTSVRTLDREQPRVIKGVLADGLQNTANPTENTITIVPYYRNDYYDVAFAEADFIETVNWLRLRDVTLTYHFSNTVLKKQKVVKSASIFVTGTDLFLLTNYSGVDPNVNGLNASTARGVGGAGIDFGSIPQPRGFNFGLRVGF